ncbi:MAG: GTP-binding protein [Candidatus Lokiarchaeota archaeon]|nr:GTP-binding protein [Candidatus Lokiarchaeota archaeon]
MVYQIKISLVGLTGAGKTTLLKAISPNAYLMAESKRTVTNLEAKSWGMTPDMLINTSMVPNFTHVVLSKKYKLKGDYFILNDIKKDDIILMIIDTLGQDIFYEINKSSINGSVGIIFVLDSSIPISQQKENLIAAYKMIKEHFESDIFISVILNKQDLWERMARSMLPSYKGKDVELKKELDAVIPDFEDCHYYVTSALKNWGVKEAFQDITKKIMDDLLPEAEMFIADKQR